MEKGGGGGGGGDLTLAGRSHGFRRNPRWGKSQYSKVSSYVCGRHSGRRISRQKLTRRDWCGEKTIWREGFRKKELNEGRRNLDKGIDSV